MILTKEEAQALLPEVGDMLMEIMTVAKVPGMDMPHAQPCVVEYVHREHLWYMVRFESGIRQCYTVPRIKVGPNGGLLGR